MTRYRVEGDWITVAYRFYSKGHFINIEQADLVDSHNGQRFIGGAYRVRLGGIPEMRTKRFYGESAHSHAVTYGHDAAVKCGDWGWWPDL